MDTRVIGEADAGDPVIARSIVERARRLLTGRYSIALSSLLVEPDDEGWRYVGIALYIGKSRKPSHDYRIWWHDEMDVVDIVVI